MSLPDAIRQSAGGVLRKEENPLGQAEFKGGMTDVEVVSAIRSGDESAMAYLYD